MTQYYTKSSIDTSPKKEATKSVVTEAPVVAKKSPTKRLFGDFFMEDIPTMVTNVTAEVLKPSLKKLVLEMGTKGLQHLLNGTSSSTSNDSGDKVSYRGYYDKKNTSVSNPSSYKAESLGWKVKANAEEVLAHMLEDIERNGYLEVGKYYDYANYPTNTSDFEFGWTSLNGVGIQPIVDEEGTKFYIIPPKAKPISHLKHR